MTIIQITGGMLRAARSLAGLSQQEVADRASISRPCLTAWEGSSGAVPNANARALHRVVSALEAEGIDFTDGGVRIEARAAPISATIVHSEATA
jgi:transcriptional regulator with XRE-family HTH domain